METPTIVISNGETAQPMIKPKRKLVVSGKKQNEPVPQTVNEQVQVVKKPARKLVISKVNETSEPASVEGKEGEEVQNGGDQVVNGKEAENISAQEEPQKNQEDAKDESENTEKETEQPKVKKPRKKRGKKAEEETPSWVEICAESAEAEAEIETEEPKKGKKSKAKKPKEPVEKSSRKRKAEKEKEESEEETADEKEKTGPFVEKDEHRWRVAMRRKVTLLGKAKKLHEHTGTESLTFVFDNRSTKFYASPAVKEMIKDDDLIGFLQAVDAALHPNHKELRMEEFAPSKKDGKNFQPFDYTAVDSEGDEGIWLDKEDDPIEEEGEEGEILKTEDIVPEPVVNKKKKKKSSKAK